jgi:Tfp pilus assembly protein PilO
MRIQDIFGSLSSRWVIFTLVTWLAVSAVTVLNAAFYYRTQFLREQVTQVQREIDILSKKKAVWEQHKVEVDMVDKRLSMILADLLSASKQSGVHLTETKVALLDEQKNYAALPIEVKIMGTFNQIGIFVNSIEKNPRFRILEINLSTKGTEAKAIVGKVVTEFIVL